MNDRIPHTRSLLAVLGAACALSVAATPARAQSSGADPFLLGSAAGSGGISLDRSGRLATLPFATDADVRYAPDGSYWIPFQRTGVISRIVIGGSPFTRQLSPYADFCVTPEGHALIATDAPSAQLIELDGTTAQVATYPLIAAPHSVEVDDLGRAWVAVDNNPLPLIQVVSRGSGSSGNLPVTAAMTRIRDILNDGRRGGGHTYVCGEGTNVVLEFGPNLIQVRQIPVGDDPSASVEDLEIGPDGSVWARQSDRGVSRIDPATGRVDAVLQRPVDMFGFDSEGSAWTSAANDYSRLEIVGSEVVETSPRDGFFATYAADDPGGLFAASVLDPQGDADGDGFRNRDEVRARSNWLDAFSTPTLNLSTRLDAAAGGELRMALRGAPALGYVTLGTTLGGAVTLPGFQNAFLLTPGSLVTGLLPLSVPGELRFDVPADVSTQGVLWVQAVRFPLAGAPSFSDVEAVVVGRDPLRRIDERFTGIQNRDALRSSVGWDGSGRVRPVPIGGQGRLGSFDPTLGNEIAPSTFVFDTDDQLFPARVTLFGQDVRVTDGVFEFSDFVVPPGTTVIFRGGNPAVIRVRGEVRIDGDLRLDGADVDGSFNGESVFENGQWIGVDGQPGSAAGAGGGRGGQGADGCDGDGVQPGFSGRSGENVVIPGGSGYSGRGDNTGGGGGLLFPADGLDSSVQFNLFGSLTGQLAGGGAGGAFLGAGGAGSALRTSTGVPADLGPPSVGGSAMAFLVAPSGVSSLEHYLVGGSGGGGGGSQPLRLSRQNLQFEQRQWHAGSAGAGGGGAVALRSGGAVRIGVAGVLSVAGGDAASFSTSTPIPPSPGGGGSGGSVLLQVPTASALQQGGLIDVSGGRGGSLLFTEFNGQQVESEGGDGGHGYVRVEAPARPQVSALGNVQGLTPNNDNVGTLVDRDAWSGVQSTFYRAASFGTPDWLHYRISATVNGQAVVYSDDPANFNPANRPGSPVWIFVQGAQLDGSGAPTRIGPWRDRVDGAAGLDGDEAQAARFLILFDASVGVTVDVARVEVVFRD